MKVSLKVEYALRVLVQLARHFSQGKMANMETLSTLEEIPSNYLVQILNELRQGGIIKSHRGKQGGYELLIDPKQLNLLQVINVVDFEMTQNSFSAHGESGEAIAGAWAKVTARFNDHLQTITIDSLAQAKGEDMYYI